MSIGVFDSGVGGLTVHRALVNRLPQADFVYLADQANAPYGGRPGEEVVDLTRAGCERLFDTGASLVVLACNTASAIALRRLQQTWLPGYRKALGRPINVLGIIVPTIEAATGLPWEHEAERRGDKVEQLDVLGVFSTQGTTNSRVYEIEIDKRKQDIAVFSQACPDLVPMIEADAGAVDLAKAVEGYVQALKTRIGRYPDRGAGLHPLRDHRRHLPRRPAGGDAGHPPAGLHRRRPGAVSAAPSGIRPGDRRFAPLPDHGQARSAERPGGELLGRSAAVRGGLDALPRSFCPTGEDLDGARASTDGPPTGRGPR